MSEETYILSREFDEEKVLRVQGDSRLADYVGKNLDVDGNPDDQPPKYSDYGPTIDVPDGTNLTQGINILDRRVRQELIQWQNPTTVAVGPIFARFDDFFELTAFVNGVDITFVGEAGWDVATFAGRGNFSELPLDYFATMVGFSTSNIGSIEAVIKVVTSVSLFGRKVIVKPPVP
jgi:hypothetical protein